jgi:hypothetical protein
MATGQRPRGDTGRFTEDPDLPARDAEIADLRRRGLSPLKISQQLGIPRTNVYAALERCYRAVRAEPAEEVRAMEVERLDEMLERLAGDEDRLRTLAGGDHVTVQHGRVVYDESTGAAVPDHAAVLSCYDRIHRIEQRRLDVQARRARLLGVDAPVQAQVSGSVTYEVIGLNDPET